MANGSSLLTRLMAAADAKPNARFSLPDPAVQARRFTENKAMRIVELKEEEGRARWAADNKFKDLMSRPVREHVTDVDLARHQIFLDSRSKIESCKNRIVRLQTKSP